MEIKGGHGAKFDTCFQEFFGTAFLLFSINMTAGTLFQPVAIGVMLHCQICFTGPTCGAHFNPAVSIGVLVIEFHKRTYENIVFCLMYILAQYAGAIVGLLAVFLVQDRDSKKKTIQPGIALLCPGISSRQ